MGEIIIYFTYAKQLEGNENYESIFSEIKKQIDHFMTHYKDDPRFLSGWSHAYFCDDDGGKIIFDIERPDYHKCSICGKVYRGFQMDSCHTTALRNEAAATVEKAALIYQTCGKDKKYLDIVKHIVGFYADNYNRFPLHAKHVIAHNIYDVNGAGKIMPQGLDEAVFAIKIISALEIIKSELSAEWLAYLKKKMFTKIYALLKPQKKSIHNIPCWINSALGIMGLFFDEPEWVKEATTGEYNLYEQLEKGVTSDGFWFEGSIHYNFYALEGIVKFFAFAKTYDYEISSFAKQITVYMFDAAYKYAFDNDVFPNPSDGWPGITLLTYAHIYYLAYKAFGKRMLKYLKHIEESTTESVKLPLDSAYHNKLPIEKILFYPFSVDAEIESQQAANAKSEAKKTEHDKYKLEKRTSCSFEKYNCAILRNDIFNVFFKYGHQTASHAHPDKMNIEIMIDGKMFTKDLSNSGYASRLCVEWHKTPMAHNTCMVDGQKTDAQNPGKLLFYDGKKIIAESNPYNGVTFRRSIELNKNLLIDDFLVECCEDNSSPEMATYRIAPNRPPVHRIEWFFHIDEPVERDNLTLLPARAFKNPYFMNPYEIKINDEGYVDFDCGKTRMRVYILEDTKAYICSTYNNPANTLRDTIILRTIGNNARFSTETTYHGVN